MHTDSNSTDAVVAGSQATRNRGGGTVRNRRPIRLAAAALTAILAPVLAGSVEVVEASERVDTIRRENPKTEQTSADTLTWTITFTAPMRHSHPSSNLDASDFDVAGTTAELSLTPQAVDAGGCARVWQAELSGGDLATLNGRVSITPSAARDVFDCKGAGERMEHTDPLVRSTNHNWFIVTNDGGPVWSGPVVTVAPVKAVVVEGQDAAVVVSAQPAPQQAITVRLQVSELPEGDMVASLHEGPRTVVIPAGASAATYRVATIDDNVDEFAGTVGFKLQPDPGYRLGTPGSTAVTVTDNDAATPPPPSTTTPPPPSTTTPPPPGVSPPPPPPPPEVSRPADEFSDLDTVGTHAAAVVYLADRGVMARTGCGGGRLCPNGPIRRWEMAVWLVRVLDGDDPRRPARSMFADVAAGRWWAAHVERLAELRVTAGCRTEPLSYCPDDPVSRAQMATLLTRAFELPRAVPSGFGDIAGNAHQTSIDALLAAGVTAGCSTDPPRFCPAKATTRAQMATFLVRARTGP